MNAFGFISTIFLRLYIVKFEIVILRVCCVAINDLNEPCVLMQTRLTWPIVKIECWTKMNAIFCNMKNSAWLRLDCYLNRIVFGKRKMIAIQVKAKFSFCNTVASSCCNKKAFLITLGADMLLSPSNLSKL